MAGRDDASQDSAVLAGVAVTCSEPGDKACSDLFSYAAVDEIVSLLQDMQARWEYPHGPADLTGGLLGSACASPLCAGSVCPCPATALLFRSLYFGSCQKSDLFAQIVYSFCMRVWLGRVCCSPISSAIGLSARCPLGHL